VTRRRIALVLAVGLTLGACGRTDPDGTTSPGSPTARRPSTPAVLTIEAPSAGEVVRGSSVDLVIGLDGAELVDVTSTDLRPDQGHLHVIVDGELVSMTSGLEQTLLDLAAGTHLVKVEFVANDHAPFEPKVLAATTFEVKA